MKEERHKDTVALPLISRIPIVGSLFSSRAQQKKNTEVIVFLTPHIISGEIPSSLEERLKLIPPDIVTEDMKEEIMSRRISEIKSGQANKPVGVSKPEENRAPSEPTEKTTVDIADKMKGIKE